MSAVRREHLNEVAALAVVHIKEEYYNKATSTAPACICQVVDVARRKESRVKSKRADS